MRERVYPRRVAYRDAYAFVEKAQTGSVLAGSTADYHGYPFSVHGYFTWRHVALALAFCRPGDTLIEIGANVGTETVAFADIVGREGRVFAFEPLSDHCRLLERMIHLNRFEHVEVLPLAVGETVAEVEFALPASGHASGTGHIVWPDSERVPGARRVGCTTLDALADRLGRPGGVFVDAEGAELAILRGGRRFLREHAPPLVLEASARNLERSGAGLEDLHAELAGLGYDVYRIGRFGLTPVPSAAAARRRRRATNWLCVHAGKDPGRGRADRLLRWTGLLPMVRGVNPLARSRAA